MSLRRRLVVTMALVVAVGLVAVDVITLTSLRSYLYGRVDSQLTTAAHQVAALDYRDDLRGVPITALGIRERVSPDVYVLVLDPAGSPVVTRPSGSSLQADPAPHLPVPLPVRPLSGDADDGPAAQVYRPAASAVTVGSSIRRAGFKHGATGPQYRLLAVSVPGRIVVVATRLDSVNATLASLRAIEAGLTVGAGDLTRRVGPGDGATEIARLGRALNGMLTQIETAFAQRAGSEERLRSFLADASHELRTPLTSIQGYAELLRKDALPDPAARDRALARIEQEAARMGVLVGDLAVLARVGESPVPELVPVDLAALVAEVVGDARTIDGSRPIELDAPAGVPVLADPSRLEQLVLNLVANARAHTPPGTPVEVRVGVREDRAVLVVRDHGPGMDPEQSARVFDRFYRGTSARRDAGSGLGLFIVATLARTFGGEASVASAPGDGATFTVVLPLAGPGRAGRRRGRRRRRRPGTAGAWRWVPPGRPAAGEGPTGGRRRPGQRTHRPAAPRPTRERGVLGHGHHPARGPVPGPRPRPARLRGDPGRGPGSVRQRRCRRRPAGRPRGRAGDRGGPQLVGGRGGAAGRPPPRPGPGSGPGGGGVHPGQPGPERPPADPAGPR